MAWLLWFAAMVTAAVVACLSWRRMVFGRWMRAGRRFAVDHIDRPGNLLPLRVEYVQHPRFPEELRKETSLARRRNGLNARDLVQVMPDGLIRHLAADEVEWIETADDRDTPWIKDAYAAPDGNPRERHGFLLRRTAVPESVEILPAPYRP